MRFCSKCDHALPPFSGEYSEKGDLLCPDCERRQYEVTCTICEKKIPTADVEYVDVASLGISAGDDPVCAGCRVELTERWKDEDRTCASCGNSVRRRDVKFASGGKELCPECFGSLAAEAAKNAAPKVGPFKSFIKSVTGVFRRG